MERGPAVTRERELFKRLAIFPASFDLMAAEEVCEADLPTISSLVDKSLVYRTRDDRFALLETVQEFAAERVTVTEQRELARRHGVYFAQAVEAMAGLRAGHPIQRPSEHSTRTWRTCGCA